LKYGKLHYPQIHDEFPTFQQDNIIKQKESLSLHVAK
jgi:hypothetical protein